MAHIMDDAVTLAVPITKATDAGDGTVYVEGMCTDDDLDLDQQIIDRDFARKGLTTWFEDWGNVRQMHAPNLAPAGKAVKMEVRPEGIWIRTHVVNPDAVALVKAGIYSAYSVGISKPRIVTDVLAKNGRVVDGIFSEISLVDFPANPRSRFDLAKRSSEAGEIEVIEKVFSPAPTPRDVFGAPVEKLEGAEAAIGKRDISGKERDNLSDSDFAGPNESFPIAKPEDVAAAAHLVGKAENPEAVKASIIRIANRKGPDFVAQLPDSWKSIDPDLTKKGAKDCPNCGKSHDADSQAKFCSNCGHKLPGAEKSADPDLEKKGSLGNLGDKKAEPFGKKDGDGDGDGDGDDDGDDDDDDDDKSEKSAAPYYISRLHDGLCAAFTGPDVLKAHPALSSGIPQLVDARFWGDEVAKALTDASVDTDEVVRRAEGYGYAMQISKADPDLCGEAIDALRKAFADANPAAHPTPGAVVPGKFRRPYLSAGRAPMQASGKPRVPLTAHTPSPGDIDRGYLTNGRAAESPSDKSGSADLTKAATWYTQAATGYAAEVLAGMHDHITARYPDICPMHTGEPAGGADAAKAESPDLTKDAAPAVDIAPIIEAALTKARAGMDEELNTLRESNEHLIKRLDILEAAPDPHTRAYRGSALGALRPAPQETAAGRGDEDAQAQQLAAVVKNARHPNSDVARPAFEQLVKMVGGKQAADFING